MVAPVQVVNFFRRAHALGIRAGRPAGRLVEAAEIRPHRLAELGEHEPGIVQEVGMVMRNDVSCPPDPHLLQLVGQWLDRRPVRLEYLQCLPIHQHCGFAVPFELQVPLFPILRQSGDS